MNNKDSCLLNSCFTPTLNNMGYMALNLDDYNSDFVQYCSRNIKGNYLDLGCAFGVTTLPVLELGCKITACDMDDRHLSILKQNVLPCHQENLTLVIGYLPNTLSFPQNSFDAINLSMVLHFLSGKKIVDSLTKIFEWLKPGGCIYVTTSSPYQGTLKQFIPLYEQNIANDVLWPGAIEDIHQYIPKRARELPKFNNVFTPDVLERTFTNSSFTVKYSGFFTRKNIPLDISYDGREYTGLVACKA